MTGKDYTATGGRGERRFERPLSDIWWDFVDRVIDSLDDLGAILLAGVGLVVALGLAGGTHGRLVDLAADTLYRWFGLGAWALPAAAIMGGIALARRGSGVDVRPDWPRIISLELAWLSALGLVGILDGLSLPRAEAGLGGGLVGWGLALLASDVLGTFGSALVFLLMTVLLAYWGLLPFLYRLILVRAAGRRADQVAALPNPPTALPPEETPVSTEAPKADPRKARRVPAQFRKSFRISESEEEKAAKPKARDSRLPATDILDEGVSSKVSSRDINRAAGLLEATLADFGLPAKVIDFRVGPAVTQFAVEPGFIEQEGPDGELKRNKVRVSQISALANDLALALSASRVRIQAPVPGQAYVGIEVPNRRSALVRLRQVMESAAFQKHGSPLTIGLGRDVAGTSVAADLGAMPHLLISGTTGSGKSVCITAITVCLVMNNGPEDLRLVMIDPKRVELIRFAGLPHLFGRVETDLERIVGVLRWCTQEMDGRYRLLESARARHIEDYNRRMRRSRQGEPLPRIVILIDELADLMMMAPDQTERTLVRLAQMGRATGIHLVMATQRPSTDVVTGLIKANFPARIAFAVASSTDSRVILDVPGAETLLGRGDMLYLSPEAAIPARLQGVYVSDAEVARVVHYWQDQLSSSQDSEEAPWEELLQKHAGLSEKDEILEAAVDLVRSEGEASASMLQRRLRIGYPRAARLMDELEELGVVGRPQAGGRTREVLLQDDDEPLEPEEDEA